MSPTRRDVLASFLGVGVATAACRRRVPPPRYDGLLLGPDVERGHRIRDAARLAALRASSADIPVRRVRVVVIGGGPSGLSAAWRLVRGGLRAPGDVVVYELEDEVGGTSRGGESNATRYPWGAHYVPVPAPEAKSVIALLDELGVVEGRDDDGTPVIAEEVLCRAPEERLFYRGLWYEGLFLRAGASADDLAQWRAFRREVARWAAFRDAKGRRAFVAPVARASDDAEVMDLDRVSMSAWLAARKLTSPRLRWLVDYSCRDDYGLSVDEASAWAGIFYFAARLGRDGRSAELMTWPDGNGRLVRHLAARVGAGTGDDRIARGVTVIDVAPCSTGVGAGVEVVALGRDGVPFRLRAEHAIVATPRFVARRIVAPLRDATGAPDEALAFDYGSWAVANVHLSGRPPSKGVPFAWDNVLYESPSLGYVVATHQSGRDHGPTVWTWYYAITGPGDVARGKLLGASWREWSDVAFTDLERAHPDLRGYADRIDVWRWGHAMVRPRVGARAALARLDPRALDGAIHYAHTDLSGLALFEEAHDHGVRAAEEVLVALGVDRTSVR